MKIPASYHCLRVDSTDAAFTATDPDGHCGTETIPGSAAEATRLALRSSTQLGSH